MENTAEGKKRKNELLDIALTLFDEKGYEKTTIEDILNKSGISKGTFYYYFESKEDVLKLLAWREAEKKLELTGKIAADKKLSAIDKLNKLTGEAQKINFMELESRIKIYKTIDKYANLKFQQQLYENSIQLGAPLIQKILEQGIAEQTMKMDYPEEVAVLYIELMNRYKSVIGNSVIEFPDKARLKLLLKKKTQFYQEVFEKILGLQAGQLLLLSITMKYIDGL